MEQAKHKFNLVDHIEVRGARVHNLKNIDVKMCRCIRSLA